MPLSLHPHYRTVVKTIVSQQGIKLIDVAFDQVSGTTDMAALAEHVGEDIAAVVIPQPNFFGGIEPVNEMVEWAHQQKALAIAVVNPMSLGLLNAPGDWGKAGADIVCGEGQPMGIPLSSGGAYLGFLCCKEQFVRQVPGRIIGKTIDLDGNDGFTLTLQAREQHIRRSKATSNICTNQGLMVTAATIYMSIMGDEGIASVAKQSYQNSHDLVEAMLSIPGVERAFSSSYFHEAVIKLPTSAAQFLRAMGAHDIFAGVSLEQWYPEMTDCILVCVTETKTQEDIDQYMRHMSHLFEAPMARQLTPKA